MTYILCKNVITRGKETGYLDKVDMMKKLDMFLLHNRITQENYTELTELMAA